MSWRDRWDWTELWLVKIGMAFSILMLITLARKSCQDDPVPAPKPLDCAAQCAPRDVLPGSSAICNCAPSESWIIKVIEQADKACAGLPFDVSAAADGSFELKCGRPEKIRAMWPKEKK